MKFHNHTNRPGHKRLSRFQLALLVLLALLPTLLPKTSQARPTTPPEFHVQQLQLTGTIHEDRAVFTLTADLLVNSRTAVIPLLTGEVALLELHVPGTSTLVRHKNGFALATKKRGTYHVEITFASLAQEQGVWRMSDFEIPQSPVRELAMTLDRQDMEIHFPDAVKVERNESKDGTLTVKAFLASDSRVQVKWKPEVFQLDGELVLSCENRTIASAQTGALHLRSHFTYHIVQGKLHQLRLRIPPNLHVTRVLGKDMLGWRLDTDPEAGPVLAVQLNQPQKNTYALTIYSEQVLPTFPVDFSLPTILPLDVLRTSGFLMVGTDSAIKLLVKNAAGLTQVDQDAFPTTTESKPHRFARSSFAYQFANMPFHMDLEVSDIVTTLTCEEQLVVNQQDQDVTLDAALELDIRDAPTHEIRIQTSDHWTVAHVKGNRVADYEVHDKGKDREITVYFTQETDGRVLLNLRLEHTLDAKASSYSVPSIRVLGARAERGFILVGAEQGVHLSATQKQGLRDVQFGSLPSQVAHAQLAYRFKHPDWSLHVGIERTSATIHTDVLHVLSLGEGTLYGSSVITYHIGGAPLRELHLHIPTGYENVEFTGSELRNWQKGGDDTWTVSLQDKVSGDYTLLVTYDLKLPLHGGDLQASGISCLDVDSETGYIAVAGHASFGIQTETLPDEGLLHVDVHELPDAYAALIHDPVLAVYRYVRAPHPLELTLQRYATQQLLDQINDHTLLETVLSKEGEAVTKVVYFVKNASQQYVEIALPQDTQLWTTHVDDKEVRALMIPDKDRHVLVPVPRHRNPNTFSRVEIVYAQSTKDLRWTQTLNLSAPITTAESISSEWNVQLPETYTGADATETQGGFTALLHTIRRSTWVFLQQDTAWMVYIFLAIGFLILVSYQVGRNTLWSTTSWLATLAIGALFLLTVKVDSHLHVLDAMGSTFLFSNAASQVTLTNPVQMADRELGVSVRVAKTWIGTSGSPRQCVLLLAAGFAVVLIGRGRIQKVARPAAIALFVCAASQMTVLQPVLLVAAAILLGNIVLQQGIRRAYGAGLAHRQKPKQEVDPATLPPVFVEGLPPDPLQGSAPLATIALLACASLLLCSIRVMAEEPTLDLSPAQKAPATTKIAELASAMDVVRIHIAIPAESKRIEPVARIRTELEFAADRNTQLQVLPRSDVITDIELHSKHLRLHTDETHHYLQVLRRGTYRATLHHVAKVQTSPGYDSVRIYLPDNIRNEVHLRLPDQELDVDSPQAVHLTTDQDENVTLAKAVFGCTGSALLTWHPKERNPEKEKAVFSCEQHTLATLRSGLVSLTHSICYQIAQGELQTLQLRIPDGMSVISAQAEHLSTWRFDPDTRFFEALLVRPIHGQEVLTIVSQIPQEGLPYDVQLHAPTVVGTDRQRGTMGLAVPDSVHLAVNSKHGLTRMNLSDFSRTLVVLRGTNQENTQLKRAYRYHRPKMSIQVTANQVVPEIRVVESSQLDVSDERMVLSARLKVTIAKSGLFSAQLQTPAGYEVESLTGEGVSHWDELATQDNRIVTHFAKQMLGETTLNLVLSKSHRTLPTSFEVPRAGVMGTTRHTGTLSVTAEQGVRLSTEGKDGVSEIHPRELGILQPGYLTYRLLRNDWTVSLTADVQPAVVKADVLQRSDLSEGMLQTHCFINYHIHHAGKKSFVLQSPRPGTALVFTGQHIAQVTEIDRDQGLWRVDLQNKVTDRYHLEVSFQTQLDPTIRDLKILPIRLVEVDRQKGYLALFAHERLRVQPSSGLEPLRIEDPRSVPRAFHAGDLSDAIYCYRTSSADFALGLSVLRHESADVLPATVQSVHLTSVVSEDHHMVTHVRLDLKAGMKRQLQMQLPADSSLWTLFVNGRPVRPLIERDDHLIPLEESTDGSITQIEFIYAGIADGGWLSKTQTLAGPVFELPLAEITWHVFVPPGLRYRGFGGTMNHRETKGTRSFTGFDATRYQASTVVATRSNLVKAEEELKKGEVYARDGQQRLARQAFANAMNYSAGQKDFNEDARVQYNQIAAQQAIVGLVNRRGKLKQSHNVQDTSKDAWLHAPAFDSDGNFDLAYGKQVADHLTSKDNAALHQVADRMIRQQSAASTPPPPIQVTMPLQGQQLTFYRDLHIKSFAPISIELRMAGNRRTWLLPVFGYTALTLFLVACGRAQVV